MLSMLALSVIDP